MSNERTSAHGEAGSGPAAVEVALVDRSGTLSTLSYAVPEHLSFAIAAGSAVQVPLGARRVTGIVLGPARAAATVRLKPVSAHLSDLDVPSELLELAVWAA